MSKDELEILNDASQHVQKCPGCLGTQVNLVPGLKKDESYMGCDSCGHVWVGKDFTHENDAEVADPHFPVEPDKS